MGLAVRRTWAGRGLHHFLATQPWASVTLLIKQTVTVKDKICHLPNCCSSNLSDPCQVESSQVLEAFSVLYCAMTASSLKPELAPAVSSTATQTEEAGCQWPFAHVPVGGQLCLIPNCKCTWVLTPWWSLSMCVCFQHGGGQRTVL